MNESGEHFELLRARYARSLGDKQEALNRAWVEFVGAPSDAAVRSALQQQLHRLCGSAQAYGHERLGSRACTADSMMRQWQALTASFRETPATLVDRLEVPVQSVLECLGEARAEEIQRVPATLSAALRLVLVEDDPEQAPSICAELEARGCVVRHEKGSDLLWQTMTLWPCHAVVLDYGLSGETAVEVAALLRREPRFEQVALICFTVEREPKILRAALEAGCDALVTKTEGIDRLLDVIRECVARPDRSGRTIS